MHSRNSTESMKVTPVGDSMSGVDLERARRSSAEAKHHWRVFHDRIHQNFMFRLYPVVLAAVEADKRRCTYKAACCPCYTCVRPSSRERITGLTTNLAYSTLHIILSLYILFADDVLRAFLSREADPYFTAVSLLAFTAFVVDLILVSSLDRKFIFTFFWWIDLIASFTILVDLPIMIELTSQSSFLAAGQAAQAGSKAGRLVRVMRIIRLLRIVRLVKMWQLRRLNKSRMEELARVSAERRAALLAAARRKSLTASRREQALHLAEEAGKLATAGVSGRHATGDTEGGAVIAGRSPGATAKAGATLVAPLPVDPLGARSGRHGPALRPLAPSRTLSAKGTRMTPTASRSHNRAVPQRGTPAVVDSAGGGVASGRRGGRRFTIIARSIRRLRHLKDGERAQQASPTKSLAARRISQLLETKVVTGVILIMILLPLFEFSVTETDTENGLHMLSVLPDNSTAQATLVQSYLSDHPTCFYLKVRNTVLKDDNAVRDALRVSDTSTVTAPGDVTASFDVTSLSKEAGLWGFLRTNVLIILLAIQAVLMSKDVDSVLIRPLDRVNTFLKPAISQALDHMGRDEAIALGKRDGDELFTRLLLAGLHHLTQNLQHDTRTDFLRRRARVKIRGRLQVLSRRLQEEMHELATVERVRNVTGGFKSSNDLRRRVRGPPPSAMITTMSGSDLATLGGAPSLSRPGTLHQLREEREPRMSDPSDDGDDAAAGAGGGAGAGVGGAEGPSGPPGQVG